MKKRNYTVDFYRLMFALSFVAIHVFMVYRPSFRQQPPFVWALDFIMPFMVFAGYFMMQGYQSKKKKWAAEGITPPSASRQAGDYLKGRLYSLFPLFLVGQLFGFVVLNLKNGIPVAQWPLALLNGVAELLGLQNTGIGLGNAFVGTWGAAPGTHQLMNSPLWFVSGLWICGYLVYYMLAKWEQSFLAFITPLGAFLFWGSYYMTDVDPTWMVFSRVGDFAVNAGLLKMFFGISIGCVFWVCIDKIKDKQWSRGMRVFFTITQTFLGLFAIYRMWTPVNVPWSIPLNWGTVHVISFVFSFFLLLNADGFTKALNRKIWDLPGKLMLYIYIIHFPFIIIVGEFVENGFAIFAIVVVISALVGYVLYRINEGVVQPWMRKKPWYTPAQRELEKGPGKA